jgi:hypothetical protein
VRLKLSLAAHDRTYSLASVFCYTYGFVRPSLPLGQVEQPALTEGTLDFCNSGSDTLRAAMPQTGNARPTNLKTAMHPCRDVAFFRIPLLP